MAIRLSVYTRVSSFFVLVIFLLAFSGLIQAQGAGDPVEVTGEASVVILDDFEMQNSELQYFLVDHGLGTQRRLYFKNGAPKSFKTGKKFKVRGRGRPDQGLEVESLTAMADGDATGGETVAGAPLATPQERKVLTILVDFNDAEVDGFKADGVTPMKYGISLQEAKGRMFNETKNVAHFYQTASLGTLTIPEDINSDGAQEVYGPYKIDDEYMTDISSCVDNNSSTTPNPSSSGCGCDPNTWVTKARAAFESANPGRLASEFQHTLLIVPNYWDYPLVRDVSGRACGWGGVAHVGCGSSCWALGADGDTIFHGVVIHELGHNFGFNHARTDPDNNGTVNSEYGDSSDNMGGSRIWAKFNAPHVEDKGWIDPDNYEIQTLIPTNSAQVQALLPMDADSDWPGLRALKVERNTNSDYYLSYRQTTGHYNGVSSTYAGKLNIHYGTDGSTYSYFVTTLAPGETYNDPHNGLIITALGTGDIGGMSYMDVQVCQDTCTALPAPSALTATANSTSEIYLSWTDNADLVSGFTLEHSSDGSTWAEVGAYNGSDLFYTDTGLATATTHHYRVRAYLDSETSGWSNEAVATTDAIPPMAFFTWSADFTTVSFVDGSSDSDGSVVSRSWDFGDGNTSSATNPTHTYATGATYTVALQVTDNHGATDTFVDNNVEVSEPPFSLHYALGELTAAGSASGSYLSTHEDGVGVEILTERQSGGKPSKRHSWLEHQWNFSIPTGDLTTLRVDAWRDDNAEGDDFLFEYSSGGSSWTPMFTVNSSTETGYSFDLTGMSGSITVRVTDTDQSQGNVNLNSVHVDFMEIKVENAGGGGSAPGFAPVLNTATAVGHDLVNLGWNDTTNNESGFRIERRITSPTSTSWEIAGQAGQNATSYSDIGLDGNTTYEYRIIAYNLYGDSPVSGSQSATTGAPPPVELFVSADKSKGKHRPTLTWLPAEITMDVYLGNDETAAIADGQSSGWPYVTGNKGSATYTFMVCKAGSSVSTSNCSSWISVSY